MAVEGKGFFIWQIHRVENGDPARILARAQAAGLSHVLIKIADGKQEFGFHPSTRADLVAPVVAALHAAGLQVWGWHYIYGNDPLSEARVAARRTLDLKLDGYIINAEVEFKAAGKAAAARAYATTLRADLPNTPIALSSYRFPAYHKEFPWAAFLEYCDYVMPQVYWEQAHNPAQQLRRVLKEFSDDSLVGHLRTVIPTGSAYGTSGWRASPADLIEFLTEARALGLQAASLYSWDWATSPGNDDLWQAAASVPWPLSYEQMAEDDTTPQVEPEPEPSAMRGGYRRLQPTPLAEFAPMVEALATALNNHDLTALTALYSPTAVHVTHRRTVVGVTAIRQWYDQLFRHILPNAAFNLYQVDRREYALIIHWNVNSARGPLHNRRDLLYIHDGRVHYHSTNIKH